MPVLPRISYSFLVAIIFVFSIVAFWIYIETRASYRAVGFNDGQIHQREQTIAAIRQAVPIVGCRDIQKEGRLVELISVKGESLYLSVALDGRVRFCQQF